MGINEAGEPTHLESINRLLALCEPHPELVPMVTVVMGLIAAVSKLETECLGLKVELMKSDANRSRPFVETSIN